LRGTKTAVPAVRTGSKTVSEAQRPLDSGKALVTAHKRPDAATPSTRSLAHLGKIHSTKTRRKISKSAKDLWAKRKQSGWKRSEQGRQNIVAALKRTHLLQRGKPLAESRRNKISVSRKKRYAHDPDFRKTHLITTQAAKRKHPAPPESSLQQALRRRKIRFEFQALIETYLVDFLLPDYSLVIECDGPEHHWKRLRGKDRKRDRDLRKLGFKVLRVKNDDIQNDIKTVVQTIREVIAG
jgi:very-short-patch-repair endonuclease